MRSLAVVVFGVGAEHMVEMLASENQGPVQALGPDRADPALGVRVRVRSSDRGEDHIRPFRAEHLVEGTGELRVVVADQEPDARRAMLEVYGQVPRLLGDPCGVRMGRGDGQEHAS